MVLQPAVRRWPLSQTIHIIAAKAAEESESLNMEIERLRQKCFELEEKLKLCKCACLQPFQCDRAGRERNQNHMTTSDCLPESDNTQTLLLDDLDSSFEMISNSCDQSTQTDSSVDNLQPQLFRDRNETVLSQQDHANTFNLHCSLTIPETSFLVSLGLGHVIVNL